jgi:uncharacterized repeat protein (TIGR03803 family)
MFSRLDAIYLRRGTDPGTDEITPQSIGWWLVASGQFCACTAFRECSSSKGAIMVRTDRKQFLQLKFWAGFSVVAGVIAATMFLAANARAQTFQVLHGFTNGGDGGFPFAGLTLDRGGNLYGTTYQGGLGYGTVYKLSRAGSGWRLSTLYMFHGYDGFQPQGGVVFGPDGALYGTTAGDEDNGGNSIVFRLAPSAHVCASTSCPWTETVLYRFAGAPTDGAGPRLVNLVFDRAGNMYGTTYFGGANNVGVVFKLSPSAGGWTESVIWDFANGPGQNPQSGMIFDSAGNLYGTTSESSVGSSGAVYELSPSANGWTETTLAQLNMSGNAVGGVVMDAQGNLFGTTGGSYGGGGVYELTPSNGSWTVDLIFSFGGFDGPWDSPTLDAAGNIYGTSAQGGGVGEVFQFARSNGGWTFNDLHNFDGTDGFNPLAGVVFDSAGNMYGTTEGGGQYNYGVVWEITP